MKRVLRFFTLLLPLLLCTGGFALLGMIDPKITKILMGAYYALITGMVYAVGFILLLTVLSVLFMMLRLNSQALRNISMQKRKRPADEK